MILCNFKTGEQCNLSITSHAFWQSLWQLNNNLMTLTIEGCESKAIALPLCWCHAMPWHGCGHFYRVQENAMWRGEIVLRRTMLAPSIATRLVMASMLISTWSRISRWKPNKSRWNVDQSSRKWTSSQRTKLLKKEPTRQNLRGLLKNTGSLKEALFNITDLVQHLMRQDLVSLKIVFE